MDGTDDGRLAALFHDAASDGAAPPPGFDHADVVAASRRITARRRSALVGGALALIVVAGVGVAGVTASRDGATTAGAPVPEAASAPEAASGAVPAPDAARQDAAGSAPAPLGPGDPSACANRQDPALRALVEQVLPEVVGAPVAATTTDCRPGAERGMSAEVDGGLLGVSYLPPGTIVDLVDGAVSAPAASGGTVIVYSSPADAGASAPFADRLDAAAAYLAPRL